MAEKKEQDKKSIKLYEAEIKILLSIPEEQRVHILTALLADSVEKERPELDPMEGAVYTLISGQVERAKKLSSDRSQAAEASHKSASRSRTNDKNPVQSEPNTLQNEAKGLQISASSQQTPANTLQNPANACTNTITNTNTITDTSTSSSGEDAEKTDSANVVYLTPEPEFTGQVFDRKSSAEEKALGEILGCWRKNIGEPPVPLYRLARSSLRDGMESSLICKGIEISAAAADTPMLYLPVVLQNWQKEGLLTLSAYEASRPARPAKSQYATGGKRPEKGWDGLCVPSYDLDEINRVLLEEARNPNGSQEFNQAIGG